MGESKFAWESAELLGRIGRVFDEADEDLFAEFGDGYRAIALSPEEQRVRLIELLLPR